MVFPLCNMYSSLYFKDLESKATGRGKAIHFEFPRRGSAPEVKSKRCFFNVNPPFLNRFQPDIIYSIDVLVS